MSSFLEYPFEPNYIKSYNLMRLGVMKFNLYTEDDSDIWFWEKFIETVLPNKYRIMTLANRGKRALEPHYHKAKPEALIAVDSDFDYLCPNVHHGSQFQSNPYLLHTFTYSRESVLIERSYIQRFIEDIKFTIAHDVDIDAFIQEFSKLVYDGLIKFISLKNFKNIDLNNDEFHKCFHITHRQTIVLNSKNLPTIDMSVLSDISDNFAKYFQPYSISSAEYESSRSHLNRLGVNENNAYRFINGHSLEELVLKIIEQLVIALSNLELNTIKQGFQGKQIADRKKQVEKELKQVSQLHTHLRRYPICDNDEIHHKILAKIRGIVV